MSLRDFIDIRWKPFVNTLLPLTASASAMEHAENPILRGLTISQFLVSDVKAHIMLDGECCIVHVVAADDRLTISLEELMLSRKKADCPRKGKDYLSILRMINEQFWSNRSNYEGFPYRRIIFEVSHDVSYITGLRKFTLTQEMIDQTESLYWLMKDIEQEHRERDEILNLAKVIDMESLKSHYLVKDFFERVLELNDLQEHVRFEHSIDMKKITGISIRSGRVLTSELIYACLRINGASPSIDRYVQRMWFELILPRILENEEIKSRLTNRSTNFSDDIQPFDDVRVKLAVITLLARDDAKTWYMSDLQLSICSHGGREETYYTEKLREFQNIKFKDLNFRIHMKLPPLAHVALLVNWFIVKHLRTTHESESGNTFSYFSAILYEEIERVFYAYDGGNLYMAFTQYVCRVLMDEMHS